MNCVYASRGRKPMASRKAAGMTEVNRLEARVSAGTRLQFNTAPRFPIIEYQNV